MTKDNSNTVDQSLHVSVPEEGAPVLPKHSSCDVAIVGWGPVGMILSILLAQRGLTVTVVERWPARWARPRAGHTDGETMRTYQRMGIAEDVELIARPMLEWKLVDAHKDLLAQITLGEGGAGWKESYILYQPELETILAARADELGVKVFMNYTATAIEQDDAAAHLFVRATEDEHAATCVVDASYLIGADGAGSFVRGAIGVQRRDLGFKANDQLVIDFEHADADRDVEQLPGILQVLDSNRPHLAGRWSGGRWSRWEFQALDGESRDYLSSEETCWKFLADWGIHPGDGEIVRRSVYTFEATLAERWRVGRVILAGDSAHTMPPFMGQGLCSGIRDSMNLAWKIADVIKGKAGDALLDTYESERTPHVMGIIKMSMAVGETCLMFDPVKAKQRDDMLRSGWRPTPEPFPRLGEGVVTRNPSADMDGRPSFQGRVALDKRVDRLDEFLKPGWRIVGRHPVAPGLFNERQQALLDDLGVETAHVSRGANAQYVDIDGEYDRLYLHTGRKAFLLRPDNYVFGSAATMEDLPALVDELAEVLAETGWHSVSTEHEVVRQKEVA